ncbi:MAG: hypothetical protein GC182_09100 [Rhodopseudomonas sp.]|nr:hypothetical protein [Rhodopseudomonas sp.]
MTVGKKPTKKREAARVEKPETTEDNASVAATIIDVESLDAEQVFAEGGSASVIAMVEKSLAEAPSDISTASGRKAIISFARRITRTKTMLDEIGKSVAAEWKKKAGGVDAERRAIKDSLDEFVVTVRKPVDDYEAKETLRLDEQAGRLAWIEAQAAFETQEPSAKDISERIEQLAAYGGNWDWQEFASRADDARARVMEALKVALGLAMAREAQQAELERLRADAARRDQADRDRAIAAQAADAARRAAEKETSEKVADAALGEAEARRKAEEADQARIAAVAEAEAVRRRASDDAKAAAVDAAEKAIEAERQRVADERAAEQRAADARAADKAHRGKINGAACAALVSAGIPDDMAKLAMIEIIQGRVPAVTISY